MKIIKVIPGLLMVGVSAVINGMGNYFGKVAANKLHKKMLKKKELVKQQE